jgi:hypothetical protein
MLPRPLSKKFIYIVTTLVESAEQASNMTSFMTVSHNLELFQCFQNPKKKSDQLQKYGQLQNMKKLKIQPKALNKILNLINSNSEKIQNSNYNNNIKAFILSKIG